MCVYPSLPLSFPLAFVVKLFHGTFIVVSVVDKNENEREKTKLSKHAKTDKIKKEMILQNAR